MKIKRIIAENYKTYKALDLNLEVAPDRPIILIGGANGCGKTTLFDAIYHALYGLKIKNAKEFEELFNAGVMLESGMDGKRIVLEIHFSGMVLGTEQQYSLQRSYLLYDQRVRESVTLKMGGATYHYGSETRASERAANEEIVNKILAANLPAELSNYFLFDAMKTSDLVKVESINRLIQNNINMVMGFKKYHQLQEGSEALLAEKKAERLENENQRKEYQGLVKDKEHKEEELEETRLAYTAAINFANDNKEQYEQVKQGRNADEVTRDKMRQIEESIKSFAQSEIDYRKSADALAKELETRVVFTKLASIIRTEVEVVINAKRQVIAEKGHTLTDSQLDKITRQVVELVEQCYIETGKIDVDLIVRELKEIQESESVVNDPYAYLSDDDMKQLEQLVNTATANPFLALAEQRDRINAESEELPRRRQQLEDYRKALSGTDYSIMELYESNNNRINELKEKIAGIKGEIEKLQRRIATYDYDIPQIPDPQYDMLCKLPDFFNELSQRLLRSKKTSIENMMRDWLNEILVVYAGVIGSVKLSNKDSEGSEETSFKIYHKNGNEIFLSQLNAGAKQTVMQVLLKVLYKLADYDPPVMIDTVMGVLDKESRELILEKYFPDLAEQTILLSTDTEITTEHDFEKIQAYVARTYTLHRDKENQCTTITEDYFGCKTRED